MADELVNDLSGSRRAVDVEGAPVIVRGSLWCYRIVDVAEAIDLETASKLLATEAGKQRTTFVRPLPRRDRLALRRAMPTLGVDLAPQTIELVKIDRTLTGKATAHLYERGTIAVATRLPLASGTVMSDLPRVVRHILERIAPAVSAAVTARRSTATRSCSSRRWPAPPAPPTSWRGPACPS